MFKRLGKDLTGWKKTLRSTSGWKLMLTKKTCAGIKPNSQFCYSQHKHATLPWHTRLSSMLASAAKNFSPSFRTEGGRKQTQSTGHEVSTHSIMSLIPKSMIWYQLCEFLRSLIESLFVWLNVSLSNANKITPNQSLYWRVYLQMMCNILLLHNLSFIKLVIVLHVIAPVCCNSASGELHCGHTWTVNGAEYTTNTIWKETRDHRGAKETTTGVQHRA